MELFIPKDIFDNPTPPQIFLCTTGKKIMGELPVYDTNLNGKWGAYSELTFSIDRQYVDVLTGEMKVHPLFDKAEGLRKVYVRDIGYFVIQDPDDTYSDKDSKTLSCFSSEYETGSKYLENFRINTGEVDSVEVTYLSSIYGENYTMDTPYKLASGAYSAYEKYYIKAYTDSEHYTYEQIQIKDATEYWTYFDDGANAGIQLYVKNYPNVQFLNEDIEELSLLHNIFQKIPEWKIGYVDPKLKLKERTFNEDRIAVYDFLMNNVQDAFDCVVEWDTTNNLVNFYEEAEDGINEDDTVQTRFETDVYISRENLANEIKINYSTDDIKTKLKVSAGTEDLDVRDINLGSNYIMNLDYYHNLEWMDQELFEAYQNYLDAVEEYTPKFLAASNGRIAAYNRWNDLMNAIPAEAGVILVGDTFEKLYCTYEPYDTAYISDTLSPSDGDTLDVLYSDAACNTAIEPHDSDMFVVQGYCYQYKKVDNAYVYIDDAKTYNLYTFMHRLNLYHVDDDLTGNKSDNILLTLKNKDADIATIRIYDPKQPAGSSYDDRRQYYIKNTNNTYSKVKVDADTFDDYAELYMNNYIIQMIILRASSGLSDEPKRYTLSEWVSGQLTANYMSDDDTKLVDDGGKPNHTVASIGTIGAYFCLAKDETSPEVLEDYGINLLKEKHAEYTSVFQAQTEAMFSNQNYQCVVQDEAPAGNIATGVRWLDTNSSPVVLRQYDPDRGWVVINEEVSETERGEYENYQRYIDNYQKLVAVQEELVKKETEAEYLLEGYAVSNRSIYIDRYQRDSDGVLRYKGQSLEADMERVAAEHFNVRTSNIVKIAMDTDIPLYTFYYAGKRYVVYLNGTTPYVSIEGSQGVYQLMMDRIAKLTNLENFFTLEQWTRLSPFIREDEFNDSNFILTGYESEEERLSICNELVEAAGKELKSLSQPSLKFSMTMANILALPEFEPLINQFQLGNFVRVHIRDGYVKRSRLLEVHLNFDDMSDFSCTFGDLITTKSEIDKHADLMKQALTAGKTVATSAKDWQKAVDKTNKLEEDIIDGLANATVEIGKASGQSIVWNESGIWGRKLIDGTTDQYEPEQFRLVNNRILFSNDSFVTSKGLFGEYTIDGVNKWGVLAEAVDAGSIRGCSIEGGTIKIGLNTDGTYAFAVNADGTVTMGGGSTLGGISVNDLNNAVFNSKNKVVHTSKPTSYNNGDLWVLAAGETCGDFGEGSILRAIMSSEGTTLNEAHWIDAVEDTTAVIRNIKESFLWDDTGIQVAKRATDANGNISTPFYVHIDSERMGFHSQTTNNGIVKDVEVVHVGNNSAIIQNATFEGGDGTTFNNDVHINEDADFHGAVNMYNTSKDGFAWQVEDDGSFSLMVID